MEKYDTGLEITEELVCVKCGIPLAPLSVTLSYMNSSFPVELPGCPRCGEVYIPEELATGRMLHVEKNLEDK
jgi:predicted RNA-binding Zn-ribbon protein involved in translation (DUF1610 family)